MNGRRRAFFLVLALFMVTLISVMALAFLGGGPMNYRTSLTISLEQQARWLALAGIEDARLKLQKDPDFPPPMGDEGIYYSYAEQVSDVGGGAVVGSFEVTIDQSHAAAPYYLIILDCNGLVVRQGQLTKKSVRAEIDVSPKDRRVGHETDENPNYYRIVNWSEEGL